MEAAIDLRSNRGTSGPSRRSLAAALLLSVFLPASLLAGSQPKELFQKASRKESIERNLEAAISFYQQTVGHPLVDAAMAGEARLRMGLCYEKLGKLQEAESVYRQLLDRTSGVSPDIIQQAKVHLRQVEAENILGMTPANPGKVVWVRKFKLTPLSVLFGPGLSAESGALPTTGLTIGLRWRLSAADRPQRFYLEARALAPLSNATTQTATNFSTLQGTTQGSLKIQYQTFLGLLGELPHGSQRVVIPEVGAGLALTASQISSTNSAFSGDSNEKHWSPYLQTGLHLYSDRKFSLLLHATYLPTPYPQSIQVPGQTASSFSFSSSQWIFSGALQMKIGFLQSVPEIQK